MSDPENPTTIKRLVQEIVQLTRKIVDLTAERETLEQERHQYQRERHHYQHRFLEERQKRLQLERELFEMQDPNYLEEKWMVPRQALHKQRWTEHPKRTQAVKWEDRETREQAAPDFTRPGERDQARQEVPPRVQ